MKTGIRRSRVLGMESSTGSSMNVSQLARIHNTDLEPTIVLVSSGGDTSTDSSALSSSPVHQLPVGSGMRRSARLIPLIPLLEWSSRGLVAIPEAVEPVVPLLARELTTSEVLHAIVPDSSLSSFPSFADNQSMLSESVLMNQLVDESQDVTGGTLDPADL